MNGLPALIPRTAWLFALMAGTAAIAGKPASFTRSAPPGKFDAVTVGNPAAFGQVRATLRMVAFDGTPAWPPAACIGVQQGADRGNSVQVLAIRNHPEDQYLVVGYRFVRNGREEAVRSFKNVPLDATVHVGIGFQGGQVSIEVDGQPRATVKTPFAQMTPYASVSSGEAAFTFTR